MNDDEYPGLYIQIKCRKTNKMLEHVTIKLARPLEVKTAILQAEARAANRQLEALQATHTRFLEDVAPKDGDS